MSATNFITAFIDDEDNQMALNELCMLWGKCLHELKTIKNKILEDKPKKKKCTIVEKPKKKKAKIDEDDAEVIRDGAINILRHKRIPKLNKHKDSAYFEAVEKQKRACGKRGGFVKGSGYHYELSLIHI